MITRRSLLTTTSLGIASSLSLGKFAYAKNGNAKKTSQNHLSDEVAPIQTIAGPVDIMARWACVLDYETRTILLDKQAQTPMPPSSLTKMMTMYITFMMLRAGRIHLNDRFPVSQKAWHMGGSRMFISVGKHVRVSDLIQGAIIQSGNDACVALAEGIAGSEEQFVGYMNSVAGRIGLRNSHFANVTGWPAMNHYMSPQDIALVAWHLIHDFPEYYHFFSEKDFTYNGIRQENRNTLVVRGEADGLKTGHTDNGGFGLCASAHQGERRVIVVINGLPSEYSRIQEGEYLVNWYFMNFEKTQIINQNVILDYADVWMGKERKVPVAADRNCVLPLPHNWRKKMHLVVNYNAPLIAPIYKGEHVGNIVFELSSQRQMKLPLVATQNVEKLNVFGRALRQMHL